MGPAIRVALHGANRGAARGRRTYCTTASHRPRPPTPLKGSGVPPRPNPSRILASRSVSAPPRQFSRPPPLPATSSPPSLCRRHPASPSQTDPTTALPAPRRPCSTNSSRRTPLPRGDRSRLDVAPAPPTPSFTFGAPPPTPPSGPPLRRRLPSGERRPRPPLPRPASRPRRR